MTPGWNTPAPCNCVHRAMQQIKQRCRSLIEFAVHVYCQGDPLRADEYFGRAFDLSCKLMELSVILPESVDTVVDACLNRVDYCNEPDESSAVRALETTLDILHNLVRASGHGKAVRATALDHCVLLCHALADTQWRKNHPLDVAGTWNRFDIVWRCYGPELIRLH